MTEAERMAKEVTLEILKMTSQAEKQFWPTNIVNLLSWEGSGLISRVAKRTREECRKIIVRQADSLFDAGMNGRLKLDKAKQVIHNARWEEDKNDTI